VAFFTRDASFFEGMAHGVLACALMQARVGDIPG